MYGLINKSLKTMILDAKGERVWAAILKKSGVPVDSFVSMRRYDDAVTYALVGAASEVLGESAEKCLEIFGHYWATVTAPQAYGVLLDSTGSSLMEFLVNVNGLHDRITSTFIGYEPPYFIVDAEGKKVSLRYESRREGLTPFVIGVVKGLAERFGNTLLFSEPEHIECDKGEISVIHFTIVDPS
jgi:hypothetical protein